MKLKEIIKEYDVDLFPLYTCCNTVCSAKFSINIPLIISNITVLAIAARRYFINRQFMAKE